MFNKLGLGIELSFKDDFSDKSKNVAGAFDNMRNSAKEMVDGIDSEMIRLNAVLTSAFAMDKLGRDLEGFGRKITDTFKKISNEVVNTGSMMENFMVTYTSLYKDKNVARQKIDWAVGMGKTTPFESTEVLESMIGLKASGIDVDKKYTASDGTTKTLLEFIGDMGALRPDQGLGGAMWAFRNLIGGQSRSFVTRFDMNPEQILGREMNLKGTPDDIAQDFVEIASKVAPNLLTGMEGTWSVLMSNLEDFKFELMRGIAESGLFEEVKSTLTYVQQKLEDADLLEKGKTISSILQTLFKPIGALVRKITDLSLAVLDFVEVHPEVSKFFGVFAGGIGIITVFLGKALSVSSNLLISITLLRRFRRESKLAGSVFGDMGLAFSSIGGFLLKAITAVGLFALAYKNNLFGIRDITKNVLGDIGDKFKIFKLKLQVIGKTLFQDEGGKVFFGEDLVKELQENDLWEFAQNIVGLKGHITEFFKGFSEGIKEVLERVKEAWDFISTKFNIDKKDKDGGLLSSINEFLGGEDVDVASIGKKVGKFITVLLLVKTAFKIVKSIFKIGKGIFGIGRGAFGIGKGVFSKLWGLGKIVGGVGKFTGKGLFRGARGLLYGGKALGGKLAPLLPHTPLITTALGAGKGGYDLYKGIKGKDKDRKYKGIAELGTTGLGAGIGASIGTLLGGPAGAILGAKIGGGAGGIASMLFGDNLGKKLQEGVELTKEKWSSFTNWATEKKESFKEGWNTFLTDINNKVTEKHERLREIGGNIKEAWSTFFENLKTMISNKVSEMRERLDSFLGFITGIPSKIKSGLDSGKERVKGWLGIGGKDKTKSSNWGGLSYVPYDNYTINAHEGEMLLSRHEADVLKRGKNVKENATDNTPTDVDNSITIENVEIILQANGSDREEARRLALMVLEEIESLKVQSNLRNYQEYVRG